jgi:hypothetical protein
MGDRLPPSEQVYRMGELLRVLATAEDILPQKITPGMAGLPQCASIHAIG